MAVSGSHDAAPLPWQAAAWERLGVRLAAGRLPHALLLAGVAGTGKELFARAFARLTLCLNPRQNRPCGACRSCRTFLAGAHPDWRCVTVEEARSVITVDQIRELGAQLTLTGQRGGRKAALIVPAEAMNLAAANSLLKTLEEPPAGTLLLLVSANPARLPATIRSRCQRLAMPAPARELALGWLNDREPRQDWPALLGLAGGGPLLAQQLAREEFIGQRLTFYRQLAEVAAGRHNPLALAAEAAKHDLPVVLRLLQAWVMDLIALKSGASAQPLINGDAATLLQTAAQGIHLRGLHVHLSRVQTAVRLAATSVNRQLLLENLFADWGDGLRAVQAEPLAAAGEQT